MGTLEIAKVIIEWIIKIGLVYMASILIHHFLDKLIKRGRLDNLILYRLTSKMPLASTKVILETEKRPNLQEIQKKMETLFEKEGFNENKIINQSNYQFKIKKHPTLFSIKVIEGDEENPFTLTLETMGEDKIPFFIRGYFSKTISFFEEIVNELEELELKTISVKLSISSLIGKEENITCTYQGNAIGTNTISVGNKNFTKIQPLVTECLKIWRNNFI